MNLIKLLVALIEYKEVSLHLFEINQKAVFFYRILKNLDLNYSFVVAVSFFATLLSRNLYNHSEILLNCETNVLFLSLHQEVSQNFGWVRTLDLQVSIDKLIGDKFLSLSTLVSPLDQIDKLLVPDQIELIVKHGPAGSPGDPRLQLALTILILFIGTVLLVGIIVACSCGGVNNGDLKDSLSTICEEFFRFL